MTGRCLLRPHTVQLQHRLLLLALQRDKTHSGTLRGFPDRLGIRGIGLVPLDKRSDELRLKGVRLYPVSTHRTVPPRSEEGGVHFI